MKKLLLIALIMVLGFVQLDAQRSKTPMKKGKTEKTTKTTKTEKMNHKPNYGQTPSEKATIQTQKLKIALKLDEEQQRKTYNILFEAAKSLKLVKMQRNLNPQQKEQAIEKILHERDIKMQRILDKKQRAKYKMVMGEMQADGKPIPRPQSVERKVNMLHQMVMLSPAQKMAAKEIYTRHGERLNQLMAAPESEERNAAIEALRKQQREEIKEILNEDQLKRFTERSRTQSPTPQKDQAERRATKMTKELTDKLGLSEQQSKMIQNINLKTAKEMEKLQDGNMDGKTRMRAIKKLNSERDNSITSLLTKEQKKAYTKIKKETRGKLSMPSNKSKKVKRSTGKVDKGIK